MTEAIWTQGDDPSRMMRYLLRHPPLHPTFRKTALLGAACARLAWTQIDTDKVRQLIECQEKCADDPIWQDQYNALCHELVTGAEVFQQTASAIVFAGPVLSIIEATLNVPNVSPSSVCAVMRDLFGNPFRQSQINPLWLEAGDGTVRQLAMDIYAESAFDRLPILADALEEAGCEEEILLHHFRSRDRHFRGCWAIDALLGKTDAEPDQTAWELRRTERSRSKSRRRPIADVEEGF